MMRHIFAIIASLLAAYVPNAIGSDKIPVFVSIVPQTYFVEKIGADHVTVISMTAQGADVHTFEPKPRQMTELAKAKVYFAIGVEFEHALLEKIAAVNAKLMIVHTDRGISKIPMKAHHHEETGEKAHHGEHDGTDPHIWLSPNRVKLQAKHILDALVSADPNRKAAYLANYEAFVKELVMLDAELKFVFSTSGKNNKFMVFHPSWGYFAKDYGLEQIPVEIEGKEPKPAELREMIEHAKADGIRVIFAQPQYSSKSAEVIAKEIRGQVIMADSLAKDWAANLRETAKKFGAALK